MRKFVFFILMLVIFFLNANIVNAALGDFRSKSNGNWNAVSTWQYHNGSTWVDASWTPGYTDADVTIQAGHSVTITSSVTVDQVNVKGNLTLNSGVNLTINDGSSTDVFVDNTSSVYAYFYVYGTVINHGTLSKTDGVIYYYDNSVYQHSQDGGTVEDAVWSVNSTCEITGYVSSNPSNLDQNFGNFKWNCTGQTSTPNLTTIPTVMGNFLLLSTGSASLTLSVSANTNMFIYGDYFQSGGYFFPSNGSADDTLFIGGNFNMSGGRLGGPPSGSGSTTVVFMKNGIQSYSCTAGQGAVTNMLNFYVKPNSILDLGTGVLGDPLYTSGSFVLSSGGGLMTAHASGIMSGGSSGCVQVIGSRSYSSGANYTFYANGSQSTGSGLQNSLSGTVAIGSSSNTTNLSFSNSTLINNTLIIIKGSLATANVSYGSSAILEYRGYALQTMGNNEWPSATVPNLKINNSSGVNINSVKTVSNTLYLSSGALNIGTNTLNLNGSISTNSGSINGGNTSNINFGGSGSTNMPGITNGLGNLTLNRSSSTISLTGTLTIYGIMTMTQGVFSLNGGLLSYGNSAVLKYNRIGSAQTSTDAEFPANNGPYYLFIDNSSGFNLHSSRTLNGNLTLNNGVFSIGSNTLTINGFIVKNSGSLSGGTSSGITFGENAVIASLPQVTNGLGNLNVNRSGGVEINGNLTIYNTLTLTNGAISLNNANLAYGSSGVLQYNGSSSQTTSDTEFPVNNGPYSLIIANNSVVNMHSNRTIPGTLTLADGSFSIGNNHTLTLNGIILATGGSFTGGSSSNIIFNEGPNTNLPSVSLNNLEINRINGVNLSGDVNIIGELTLNIGSFNLMNRKLTINHPIAGNPSNLISTISSGIEISGNSSNMNIGSAENIRITNVGNLFISNINSSGTFLNGGLSVNNTLFIQNGSKLIINPGFNLRVYGNTVLIDSVCLVIKSDSTGTASFIDNGITYFPSSSAKVERYLSGNLFHMISLPISNTIFGGTGHGQTGNVFLNCSLDNFNEPSNTWHGLTQNDNVIPDKGYITKYFYGNGAPDFKVLSFKGNLNTGDKTYTITKSGQRYNLVPNPYPSSVDWDNPIGWDRLGLELNNGGYDIWIWNPNPGINNWGTYNSGTHIGTNGVTNHIATGQSFFIRASTMGGTVALQSLTVRNFAREHSGQPFLKANQQSSNLLRIKVSNGVSSDEAVVFFDTITHLNSGSIKWFSMSSEAPNLYMNKNNEKLCVNTMPYLDYNIVVPLSFKAGSDGLHHMSFDEIQSFDPLMGLFLEDLQLNIIKDLRINPVYSFNSGISDNPDRFLLHFNPNTTGISSTQKGDIYSYVHGNEIFVSNTSSGKATAELYNTAGQLLNKVEISGYSSHQISLPNNRGVFIVRISDVKNVSCSKFFLQSIK